MSRRTGRETDPRESYSDLMRWIASYLSGEDADVAYGRGRTDRRGAPGPYGGFMHGQRRRRGATRARVIRLAVLVMATIAASRHSRRRSRPRGSFRV